MVFSMSSILAFFRSREVWAATRFFNFFRWSFSSHVRWSKRRFLPRVRNSSIEEVEDSSPSSGRDSVLMVIPAGARFIGTYLVGTVMTIGALMIAFKFNA